MDGRYATGYINHESIVYKSRSRVSRGSRLLVGITFLRKYNENSGEINENPGYNDENHDLLMITFGTSNGQKYMEYIIKNYMRKNYFTAD
jgi:hypothetical protein